MNNEGNSTEMDVTCWKFDVGKNLEIAENDLANNFMSVSES